MGWEDSDDSGDEWDQDQGVDANEQYQKDKEKQRRIEEGIESDSEDEAAAAAAAAAAKPKPKPKPKAQVEDPTKNMTPEERKIYQRKKEEEMDARAALDIFAGCEVAEEVKETAKAEKAAEEKRIADAKAAPVIIVKDLFDDLELTTTKEVEKLAERCFKKIDKGTLKNAHAHYLVNLLKVGEGQMQNAEIDALEKMFAEMVKEKKFAKSETQAKANKANTKLSKTTKFNASAEWEEVYGGGGNDEEWTQEEWDAWEKRAAK